MIVTVTLNPTMDIAVPVDNFTRGSVLRAGCIFSYPGGKGTNVARALASLGSDVLASGFTGKKNKKELVSFLSDRKVKPDFLAVPGSNRLCILITEKNGLETVVNSESNIGISAKARLEMLSRLGALSKKADIFVFSGSLPLSVPDAYYADCIRAVRKNSTVILDTSSKYLRKGVTAGPHIIKQNLNEFESAFDCRISKKSRMKRSVSSVSKKFGIKIIIITMGEKGSLLFDNGSFYPLPAEKNKKVISPVGSGDAYSAGLAYGIENGMGVYGSCRLAAACSAANLAYPGACFFKRSDLKKYGF